MNVWQILVSAIISAGVTIILGIIIKRPLEKRAEAAEKQAQKESERQKATMLGVQALLRDRLLQGYRHYEEKGFADYDDRSNMENIYNAYHGLGKNGVMDDMRQQFLKLPQHR
jgi:hypothetical protein